MTTTHKAPQVVIPVSDGGEGIFHTQQSIDHLAASLAEIRSAVHALDRLVAEAGFVADAFSREEATDDQREQAKALQVESAQLFFELVTRQKRLTQFAAAQLDLPTALRASLELVQGQGVA